MMYEIEHRTWVDEYCFRNEYELQFGVKRDEIVVFQYYNKKHDKEGKKISKCYLEALELARSRSRDGRYKNYEFLIYKE